MLGLIGAMLIGVLAALIGRQSWSGRPIGLESVAISRPTLQQAESAFRRGQDRLAAAQFTALSNKNDPTAQYWLGHMTELGLGARRDPAKAIELYKQAAAHDVAAAQLRLGEIYMHGDLAPPDFALAKSYLEKAAYRGDPRAALLLGQIYRRGLGTAIDTKEAYAWSEVSALEGSELARRDRGKSLQELSPADQKVAIGRAHDILAQVERETAAPKQG
jgi:TPR repeat protein